VNSLALALTLFAGATQGEAAPPTADVFVELNAGFVPFANDVPLMLGAGVRLAQHHEVWVRAGWMPTGDDVGHAFGLTGYRYVFRPDRLVRPFAGALVAGLPATCGHDAEGRPSCTSTPLFIFSAVGGLRLQLAGSFDLSAALMLGTDSYPNPFGMVELGATFYWPFGH
jgi:hypothetical protein